MDWLCDLWCLPLCEGASVSCPCISQHCCENQRKEYRYKTLANCKVFHKLKIFVLWFIGWLSVPRHLYRSVHLNVPLYNSMEVGGGGFQAIYLKGNHDCQPRWFLITQALTDGLIDGMNLHVRPVRLFESFCWVCMDTFWFVLCLVEDLCTSQMERKPYRCGRSLSWMVGEGYYIWPMSGTLMFPGGGGEETQDSPVTSLQVLALWEWNYLPLHMIMHPGPNAQGQANGPQSRGLWNDSCSNQEMKEALAVYRFQQLGM